MDIALCVIDHQLISFQYSGAYNNLYLIRNGDLIEYQADRMPIGIFEKPDTELSSSNIIKSYPDYIIYLFSDGYADQFGGPNYKKYNYATLKSFLLKVHQLPLAEQKQKLEKEFYDWKRANTQIDRYSDSGIEDIKYPDVVPVSSHILSGSSCSSNFDVITSDILLCNLELLLLSGQ